MSNDVKNWTANQLRLIDWLATPSALRNPHTQAQFAQEIGVREETISRWKRESGLTEAAAKLAKDRITGDLPDIYGALVQLARAGSFQHIKLALEVAGEHTDEVNVNVTDRRSAIATRLAALAKEGAGEDQDGATALRVAPNPN